MPRAEYKNCKECGKHVTQVGPLSHNQLCRACSMMLEERNYVALTTRSGTDFLYWRARVAASVGGVLLDDLERGP